MKQPSNYGRVFSEVYDELMTSSKYDKWKSLLAEKVKKYDISGDAVDLACGTGEICKILLDLGFNVLGVDKSAHMISIAREKIEDEKVKFLLDDLRSFETESEFNLAVSFYDSLNYLLTINDLVQVFKNVHTHLRRNGYFIFDMNPKEHVRVEQKAPSQKLKVEGKEVMINSGGRGDDVWSLNIIIKDGEKSVKETHLERGYSSEEIEEISEECGYKVLEVINETKTYWDDEEHLSRQYYILRKE